MKINGSLVFDASSASEIQNLRLEKFSTIPAAPVTGDNGRLIYVTGTGIIYVAVQNVWVPLATGGDASALLAEVDRIETALGLNGDGSFDPAAFTGNLAGKTTYVELITTLQGLIATAQTAADDERTRAMAAEGLLDGRIDTEVTDRTAADDALDDRIDAEASTRAAADTVLTNGLAAEVTRATDAETALGGRIDTETQARIDGDAANATLVSTERDARIAGDDALGVRIDDEEDRATTAEQALDGRITTEVADRTAAVNTVATGLATEISDRQAADTAQTTALSNEITRATGQEAAIRGELASALVGLSWEAPVDLIATDAAANAAGKPDGFRIVDTTLNQIFTVTGGAVGTGEALVDGAAFFNRTNDTGYTFNGTEVVPFSGASSFVAGAGLSMAGNTVNVGNTDGSITVTADEISVSEAVRTEITDNAAAIAAEEARATTAEEGLDDRIDDEVAARTDADANEVLARNAAILVETDRAKAAEVALQAEIDAAELALTNEVTARDAAILVETNRATAREDAIEDALEAEVTRATGREDEVEAAVEAEVDRAEAAELALAEADTATNARISKMYFLYADGTGEAAAAATHVVEHNLGQSYCNVTVIAGNEVVIPQSITFNTLNRLTVTFNTPISCRVVVMGLAA